MNLRDFATKLTDGHGRTNRSFLEEYAPDRRGCSDESGSSAHRGGKVVGRPYGSR